MARPDKIRYLQSMADELHSQATRVRDLIGDVHWLSDGHHKESILRDLVCRYLPAGFIAARGFVVAPNDDSACSKEQDILIIDCLTEPPLFYQGGLVITFPRDVVAAISVKTKMGNSEVQDSLAGLNTVRNVALISGVSHLIWCGSYHFELAQSVAGNPSLVYEYCDNAIRHNSRCPPGTIVSSHEQLGPDFLCSAKDLAFKFGYSDSTSYRIRGFNCGTLATSLFLANFLDHLAHHRGCTDSDFGRFVDCPGISPLDTPVYSGNITDSPAQQ